MKPSCFMFDSDYDLWLEGDRLHCSGEIHQGSYRLNICKDCNAGIIPDLQQKMTKLGLCEHPLRYAGPQTKFRTGPRICSKCGFKRSLKEFKGEDGFYMHICRSCVSGKNLGETRTCKKCNKPYPLDMFYKMGTTKNGGISRRHICINCITERTRERYLANPEPAKERGRMKRRKKITVTDIRD